MGRELRRKQAKREGKEFVNEDLKVEGINFKNLIKLIIFSYNNYSNSFIFIDCF